MSERRREGLSTTGSPQTQQTSPINSSPRNPFSGILNSLFPEGSSTRGTLSSLNSPSNPFRFPIPSPPLRQRAQSLPDVFSERSDNDSPPPPPSPSISPPPSPDPVAMATTYISTPIFTSKFSGSPEGMKWTVFEDHIVPAYFEQKGIGADDERLDNTWKIGLISGELLTGPALAVVETAIANRAANDPPITGLILRTLLRNKYSDPAYLGNLSQGALNQLGMVHFRQPGLELETVDDFIGRIRLILRNYEGTEAEVVRILKGRWVEKNKDLIKRVARYDINSLDMIARTLHEHEGQAQVCGVKNLYVKWGPTIRGGPEDYQTTYYPAQASYTYRQTVPVATHTPPAPTPFSPQIPSPVTSRGPNSSSFPSPPIPVPAPPRLRTRAQQPNLVGPATFRGHGNWVMMNDQMGWEVVDEEDELEGGLVEGMEGLAIQRTPESSIRLLAGRSLTEPSTFQRPTGNLIPSYDADVSPVCGWYEVSTNQRCGSKEHTYDFHRMVMETARKGDLEGADMAGVMKLLR
jgi:hypothetical protein